MFFQSCFIKDMKLFTGGVINSRQKKSQSSGPWGPFLEIPGRNFQSTLWARSHILKSKSDEY